ncbi:DUF2057 domain-containing protein [Psychromonas sp.]|nr:DUF2057 domain-containing protein [Psychromonas sp.]
MKFTILILALTVSPFTMSSELIPNDDVTILAVNGVKIKTSFFGKNKIEVEDGEHQIVAKYINSFGNQDFIDSAPYIFNVNVSGNTTISTNKITNERQADEQIANGLSWFIINNEGEYKVNQSSQLIGNGIMPFSDIEKLIEEYNKQNVITKEDTPSSTTSLIAHYQRATTEEKKQFKMWLIENETK